MAKDKQLPDNPQTMKDYVLSQLKQTVILKRGDTLMTDITKNIPDHRVRELWNMVVHSNFKEDPNPLIKEMNGKVRELKEQGKI